MTSEGPLHIPGTEHWDAQAVDQVVAEYRNVLTDAVRHCREHFAYCQNIGCPGNDAYEVLAHIVQQGPGVSLAALVLAVHYMAKKTDLLEADELEKMLSVEGGEGTVLGEPDGAS